MITTLTDTEKIREVALDQYGYITTAQAEEEGVTRHSLAALARRNRLERVAQGLYRVPQVPEMRYGAFMRAILWTGVPEAALSHETALDAYGVSDINPTKIHMTVDKGRRIAKAGGEGYVLHRQKLDPQQRTWWHQIPIVTHNMSQAARISDYSMFMYLGELIEYDKTRIMFTNPRDKRTEEYLTGQFG